MCVYIYYYVTLSWNNVILRQVTDVYIYIIRNMHNYHIKRTRVKGEHKKSKSSNI